MGPSVRLLSLDTGDGDASIEIVTSLLPTSENVGGLERPLVRLDTAISSRINPTARGRRISLFESVQSHRHDTRYERTFVRIAVSRVFRDVD